MCSQDNNWPAPYVDFAQLPDATVPFAATVVVGGSKSITNRALVLAALASSPSIIRGALRSRDSELMISALRAMGTDIEVLEQAAGSPNQTLKVTPHPLRGGSVDCGLAGTVMRFLPPVAALADGKVDFDGDPEARVRPMSAVLDALRGLGVAIEGDRLPFSVNADRAAAPEAGAENPDAGQDSLAGAHVGGVVDIDSSASSQFISGLLLAAPRFGAGLRLRSTGAVPSRPHIDMTIAMLRDAGVEVVERQETTANGTITTFEVTPTEMPGRTWVIEPDLSNAAAFLAAAAATGGQVTIPDWPSQTTQPGDQIREILTEMGAEVTLEETEPGLNRLTVTGPEQLRGITKDMSAIGELTPTVAALAALASSPTELTGIAHLRGHETDRLAALTTEINRLGGQASELDDGLRITPAPLGGGIWHSYADHRMATAGAIVGLRVPGVSVENIATTSKTMPDFPQQWLQMLQTTGTDEQEEAGEK